MTSRRHDQYKLRLIAIIAAHSRTFGTLPSVSFKVSVLCVPTIMGIRDKLS